MKGWKSYCIHALIVSFCGIRRWKSDSHNYINRTCMENRKSNRLKDTNLAHLFMLTFPHRPTITHWCLPCWCSKLAFSNTYPAANTTNKTYAEGSLPFGFGKCKMMAAAFNLRYWKNRTLSCCSTKMVLTPEWTYMDPTRSQPLTHRWYLWTPKKRHQI